MEFKVKELVYDIKNEAYIYAKSLRGNGIDEQLKADITDIGEDGNYDRLARLLEEVLADVREMLYAYTATTNGMWDTYITNEWEELTGSPCNDDCYYLATNVPFDFSQMSAKDLGVYLHQLMVNKTICQYLSTLYPEGARLFAERTTELEAKVRKCVSQTITKRRIRLHPF